MLENIDKIIIFVILLVAIVPSALSLSVDIPLATNYSIVQTNSSNFWGSYFYGDYNMPLILSYAYNQSLPFYTWLSTFAYNYNQTIATYNLYNTIWSSTYNSTYDLKVNYSYANCPSGKVVQNTTATGVQCIEADMPTTTYYVHNASVSGGSFTDVAQVNYTWYYDNVALNFSEGTGANPLNVYLNFTNVSAFSQIVVREYYTGNHNMKIQLYDFVTSSYQDYYSFTAQSGFTILTIPVYDTSEHIHGGNVSLRFSHVENGVSTHRLYIDFAWLMNGNNVGASTNLEGYARYNFGFNNFNGNGNFTTTGNVNATNVNVVNNLNMTSTTSCVYAFGGGRLCGNSTCIQLYSPNGLTMIQSCN